MLSPKTQHHPKLPKKHQRETPAGPQGFPVTVEVCGAYTYANDAADTYGVNNDGHGNLEGYAWGTNVGWINFNPSDDQVTIDPDIGQFDGYAWAENVGWIHFSNSGTNAYGVLTSWRNMLYYLPLIFKNVAS